MAAPSYAWGFLARLAGRAHASELDDVIEHVEQLLNTRKGYGSFLDGFGLEITDWMWAANPMVALGEHMREVIARFEPRVADARVELLARDDAEGCPTFRLHGRVGGAVVALRIWLHTPYCTVRVERS